MAGRAVRGVLVAVLLAAWTVGAGTGSASAADTPCPAGAACLYAGESETGAMGEYPGRSCQATAGLGVPEVRSAVNNRIPGGVVLVLFQDTACTRPATPEFVTLRVDAVAPPARSVHILLVPARGGAR